MVYACRRTVVRSFLTRHVPAVVVFVVAVLPATVPEAAAQPRMSEDLAHKLLVGDHTDSSVIFTGTQAEVDALAARHGLTIRKRLRTGAVLTVKAGRLATVAEDPAVLHLASDHPVFTQMDVTNQTIGADQVQAGLAAAGIPGLTGEGIGVAVIDSGVAPVPELKDRIVASLDFTDGTGLGRDEHGHGTHVAGIIAASGVSQQDETRGVAPGAHIVSLKVLDAEGRGLVGNVIAAIDWVIQNRERFNIRVMNLSLGGPVLQSWRFDPLCQAVERAYRAGIAVVASAGNFGKRADGTLLRSGVTVPGNSPFAITVGALNTRGTASRDDDAVASYSSRGPTHTDLLPKPEIVAPGNRVRGLIAPGSTLAREHPELITKAPSGNLRIELSGTSMAAAATSGAAALLISQQIPETAMRSILQSTAEPIAGERLITQGAGSLNLAAAISLVSAQDPSATKGYSGGSILYCQPVVCAIELQALEAVGEATNGDDVIIWADSLDEVIIWADSSNDVIIWADSSADVIIWADSSDQVIIWADSSDQVIIWADSNDNPIVSAETGNNVIIWADAFDDVIIWADATSAQGSDDVIIWAD